jgi:hypothetical protein
MVNFLPDFIRKEGTLISKPLPRMKFIFQEAYANINFIRGSGLEIKVPSFLIKSGRKLTIGVKFEENVKK